MTALGMRVYAQLPDGTFLRFKNFDRMQRYEAESGVPLSAMSRRTFGERRDGRYVASRWEPSEFEGIMRLVGIS